MATSELNFGHMSPSDRARESVKTSLEAMRIFVYSLFTQTGNLALVFLHKSHDGVWNIGVAKGSIARGAKVAMPISRLLAYLVVLCFERRCTKQKTVARLKSK